jgi:hypothetical protein
LASEELLVAKVLDASGPILAGCNWLRWIYLEHRRFDNREQIIERFHRIILRREYALRN